MVAAALNTTEFNVEELVSAIRKAAKELGCYESEERFQEGISAIGRHKPASPNAKKRRRNAIR